MPEVHITAQTRDEFGKGAARRIRRAGLVPAVLYGHGTETRHLTLPGHELMLALKTPNVLHRLGQRDLAPGLEPVQVQQHVRRLQRAHQLVPGQGQVTGVRAVAVQHSGYQARAADAAGGALAELITSLGGDVDLGHGANSSGDACDAR